MSKRLVSLVVALACTSCGKPTGLYPVSGTVTYQGAPATGATVFFYRQGADPSQEQPPMGVVQEDGTFTLDCGTRGLGAAPGDYAVLILWKQDSNRGGPRSRSAAQPDRLKGRYADPSQPLLHAVIQAQTNLLPPFELTD